MPRVLPMLCVAIVLATDVSAQEAKPIVPAVRGFQLGADGAAAVLRSDYVTGGRSVAGGGFGLRLGWGIHDHVVLAMDVAATKLVVADTADYFLAHADMLLRVLPFRIESGLGTWLPFLQVGGGWRNVEDDKASPTGTNIYIFEGGVFTLGVGTHLYLADEASLFLGWYHSRGDFDDERIGNTTTHNRNQPGRSSRLQMGVTWHLSRDPN